MTKEKSAELKRFAELVSLAANAMQDAEDAWPTDDEGCLVPTFAEYPEEWASFDEVCADMRAWAVSLVEMVTEQEVTR